MIVRRIGTLSAAKLGGTVYGLMGFLFGALFSLFSVVGAAASGIAGEQGAWSMLFGAGAIVILPIFYGVFGFLGMAIGALIYNLAAGWIGGLEVDIS